MAEKRDYEEEYASDTSSEVSEELGEWGEYLERLEEEKRAREAAAQTAEIAQALQDSFDEDAAAAAAAKDAADEVEESGDGGEEFEEAECDLSDSESGSVGEGDDEDDIPASSPVGDVVMEDAESEQDLADSKSLFGEEPEHFGVSPAPSPGGDAVMEDAESDRDPSDWAYLFGESPSPSPASLPAPAAEDVAIVPTLPEQLARHDSALGLVADEHPTVRPQVVATAEKTPPPSPKKKPTGLMLPPISAATIVRGPFPPLPDETGDRPEMPPAVQQAYSGPPIPETTTQAYPGASVPGTAAARVAEMPSDETLLASDEQVMAALDRGIASIYGNGGQDLIVDDELFYVAESVSPMPAALPQHPRATTTLPAHRQQPRVARPAVRRTGTSQRQPRPRQPTLAPPETPDQVAPGVASGEWGQWDPRGMTQGQYVVMDRQPYNAAQPRDVYDYLQAFLASMRLRWPGRDVRGPSAAAHHCAERAWRLIGEALMRAQERVLELEPRLQFDLMAVAEPVERGTLVGRSDPERDVQRAMGVLMGFRALGLERGGVAGDPIEIE